MKLLVKTRSFNGAAYLIAILLIVEALCHLGWIDIRFFPFPSKVLQRLVELVFSNEVTSFGTFNEHLFASAKKYFSAVGVGTLVSIFLTILAGLSSRFQSFVIGIIGFLYPLPKSALFPFLLLVFGIQGGAHIVLIMLGVVALMLSTTIAGLDRLEAAGYMEVVRILKLGKKTTVQKVLLPGLLPEFMHGLKLGASYGLVLLIVSEMLVTRLGLGVILWAAWDQYRILDLYSILFLISLMGFFIFGLFDYLGRRFEDSQRSV